MLERRYYDESLEKAVKGFLKLLIQESINWHVRPTAPHPHFLAIDFIKQKIRKSKDNFGNVDTLTRTADLAKKKPLRP